MHQRGEPVADIGHFHLKVSDLERAIGFNRDLIGMTLQNRIEGAAFLGFGDYHHLALNVWRSGGGRPPPPETTGLYHFAIRYATRRELAAAFKRVLLTQEPRDHARRSSSCKSARFRWRNR